MQPKTQIKIPPQEINRVVEFLKIFKIAASSEDAAEICKLVETINHVRSQGEPVEIIWPTEIMPLQVQSVNEVKKN